MIEKPHAVLASASWPFFGHRTLADIEQPPAAAAVRAKKPTENRTNSGNAAGAVSSAGDLWNSGHIPTAPTPTDESEIERFIRERGITHCPTAYVAPTQQASYLGPKDLDSTIVWDTKTKKIHRKTAGC